MTHENYEAYLLAGLGAVGGALRYYRPELTAKRAWIGIGVGVVAYEIAAPPNELLSEGADRTLQKYPYLTRAAIGLTALHLMNAIPEKYDPLHQGFKALKRHRNRGAA